MEKEAIAALLGALTGGVVTGVMTMVGTVWHERAKERRRAEHLSKAIAGEIAAVLDVVRMRNYISGIQQAELDARAGRPWQLHIRVTHNYFPVTEASRAEIGILPSELPRLIPRFLTQVKAVLEDIQGAEAGLWDDRSAEETADGYGELVRLFEGVMQTGTNIIATVERLYRSPSPA